MSAAPSAGHAPPLWLLTLITLSGTLAMHMFVPALPDAARYLGVGSAAVQGAIGIYILGLAVGQLAYGPLSDALGRRPLLLTGLSLYALGGIAAMLAPNVTFLVAARALQALGGCAGLALGRAMVRDTNTPDEAVRALALLNLMMMVGPGAGAADRLGPGGAGWLARGACGAGAHGGADTAAELAHGARNRQALREAQRKGPGARLRQTAALVDLHGLCAGRGGAPPRPLTPSSSPRRAWPCRCRSRPSPRATSTASACAPCRCLPRAAERTAIGQASCRCCDRRRPIAA